jgi:RimJ/RimL family protein N-acetyltransferase
MRDVARASEHPSDFSATDTAPASNRRERERLSRTLWGLDWAEHFPVELPGGFVVHASNYDAALPFIREHYALIFEEDSLSPFSNSRVTPAKDRYYRVAGDFFELRRDERTVGLLLCTPSDWSTYYIRSAAMLPEHRGSNGMEQLLILLLSRLSAAGIERVEADIAPQNVASATVLRRLGFHTAGTVLTDRWGATVRVTRFLDAEREDVFLRQFCSGVRPKRRVESDASKHPTGPERSAP